MQPSSSINDYIQFKDEVLKNIRLLENKFTSDFNSKFSKINGNFDLLEAKINNFILNNNTILEQVSKQNVNVEKIIELKFFKEKAEQTLINHEIKIKNILTDIEKMKYKYDKVINDSLIIPGWVGPGGTYKNFSAFILNLLDEFKKIRNDAEQTRNKLDCSINSALNAINNSFFQFQKKENEKNQLLIERKYTELNSKILEIQTEFNKNQCKIEQKIDSLQNNDNNDDINKKIMNVIEEFDTLKTIYNDWDFKIKNYKQNKNMIDTLNSRNSKKSSNINPKLINSRKKSLPSSLKNIMLNNNNSNDNQSKISSINNNNNVNQLKNNIYSSKNISNEISIIKKNSISSNKNNQLNNCDNNDNNNSKQDDIYLFNNRNKYRLSLNEREKKIKGMSIEESNNFNNTNFSVDKKKNSDKGLYKKNFMPIKKKIIYKSTNNIDGYNNKKLLFNLSIHKKDNMTQSYKIDNNQEKRILKSISQNILLPTDEEKNNILSKTCKNSFFNKSYNNTIKDNNSQSNLHSMKIQMTVNEEQRLIMKKIREYYNNKKDIMQRKINQNVVECNVVNLNEIKDPIENNRIKYSSAKSTLFNSSKSKSKISDCRNNLREMTLKINPYFGKTNCRYYSRKESMNNTKIMSNKI